MHGKISENNNKVQECIKELQKINMQNVSYNECKDRINKIIELIETNNIDYLVKIQMYESLAYIFCNSNKIEYSTMYINNFIELALSNKNYDEIIRIIPVGIKIFADLREYKEMVIFGRRVIVSIPNNYTKGKETFRKLFFSMVLAYRKNKDLYECLNSIEEYKKLELSEDEYIEVENIKANLLYEKEEYEDSKEIYLLLETKARKSGNGNLREQLQKEN